MNIDLKEIKRLEKLSALSSSDEKLQSLVKDFEQISAFVDQVKNADIEELTFSERTVKVDELREDSVEKSFPQKEILANAPEKGEGAFVVPKVVD